MTRKRRGSKGVGGGEGREGEWDGKKQERGKNLRFALEDGELLADNLVHLDMIYKWK